MNKENVLAVADAIEKHSIPDLGFNMGALIETGYTDMYGTDCKTVACIAGWALCLKNNLPATPVAFSIMTEAGDWLDLTTAQQYLLFCSPTPEKYVEFGEKTPAQAVAVLRHLAETGEVDWSIAK